MSFLTVTFSCVLLVQCFAQQPADLDVDNPYLLAFGLQTLHQEDQPPISLSTLYHELRNQSSEWVAWQLIRMFTAASDGDEFYNLQVELGEHNRRTAQVAMKMLLQFSTQADTETALNGAMAHTMDYLSTSSTLRHPLEVLYDQLDQQFKQNPNLSATYRRLMADSQNSTSTRKRYFNRVINAEAGYLPLEPNFVSIPGNLELMLSNGFREKLLRRRGTEYDEYVLANAIYNLGRKEEYIHRVEQIREKVTSEVLPLMLKENLVPFFFDPNWFVKEMLQRMERYINEQPDLGGELSKEKEAIEWKSKTEDAPRNSWKGFSLNTNSKTNITT